MLSQACTRDGPFSEARIKVGSVSQMCVSGTHEVRKAVDNNLREFEAQVCGVGVGDSEEHMVKPTGTIDECTELRENIKPVRL